MKLSTLATALPVHVAMTGLATAVVIVNGAHPFLHMLEGGALDSALEQANAIVGSWLDSNPIANFGFTTPKSLSKKEDYS